MKGNVYMTNKGIDNLINKWSMMCEETADLDDNPMSQSQLADYCSERLDDAWIDVMKVAWMKVIEKAEPGKEYETITRDEDNGSWLETKNIAKEGQYLIQNAGKKKTPEVDDDKDPSKWLQSEEQIRKNYEVDGEIKVGEFYLPKPNKRQALQLNEPIVFIASWGQKVYCKEGDWLVKAGEGDIYRVEKEVFKNTYSTFR